MDCRVVFVPGRAALVGTLAERATVFPDPEGFAFFGVETVIFGTVGFPVGVVSRWRVGFFRDGLTKTETESG